MLLNEIKSWFEIRLCKAPIIGALTTAGKYNFPQLAQTNYLPEEPVFTFNHLKSKSKEGRYWYHCFTDEKYFYRLYNRFEDYAKYFPLVKGIISADLNLFRDYPEQILIDKCCANRMIDYALQQAGVPMIPTAGFADEPSWEWCFDGLPLHSTVAITTNTLGKDREAHRLFVGGVNAMVKKIQPTAIVVCGKCPDWLQTKFPDIQIVQIPNHSQMWHARERSKK